MLVMRLLESFGDLVERFWFHAAVPFHRQGMAWTRGNMPPTRLSDSHHSKERVARFVITRFHRPRWIPAIARQSVAA
jgi:hypothetical protein